MHSKPVKINWTHTIFLILTPIIGIIGTALLVYQGNVKWETWVFFAASIVITGWGITAGYHRLFAHKTYKASPIVQFFLAMLGASCFEGSVFEWSSSHRDHHRFVDTDKDPYNIKRGFWYAHIGWIIVSDMTKFDFSNIKDLTVSPILNFQHKYFNYIAVFIGFVLPTIVASFWGNALAGLIIVGVLRMVVVHHGTFFINSLCHLVGKQSYTQEQSARDNWMTAFLTLGEGFHNYHHQFPLDYRNGVRYFHFDPTKWLIYSLSKLGLVSHLRRVSDSKILFYRLRVEEERLRKKHEQDSAFIHHKVEPLKAHLLTLIEKIGHLEAELAVLKNKKLDYMKDRYQSYKHQLHEYLQAIKVTQQELNQSLTSWRQLSI